VNDEDLMPFGKYKWRPMSRVPADYLLWLWDSCHLHRRDTRWMNAGQTVVASYIRENFHALETECPDRIITHRPT
jgi:hypothetical protein